MKAFDNQKNLMMLGVCPEQFPFIQELLDDGHRIIFCERDKTNINKLNNILSEAHYAKSVIIYECDLADKDRILNIAEKEKVDALIPVPLGKVFSTVGYINSQLNLPGVSYEACLNFTDKLKVYNLLKENNLNCASQWNATELDKVVFPCIVKPRFGCGSRGVKTAKNFNELLEACEFCRKDFSATIEDKDILIEEYIEGNEYSCNFFFIDGKAEIYCFLKKKMTEIPYRQEVTYEDKALNDDEKVTIEDYISKCAKALKINDSVVNCDLILSAKGPYVIDVSARFPGNFVCSIAKSKGEDLGRMYLEFIFNKKLPQLPEPHLKAYFSMFNIGSGKLLSVPESIHTANFIAENNLKAGDEVKAVTNGRSLLSRGYALCLDDSIEKAKKKVDNYLKIFVLKD